MWCHLIVQVRTTREDKHNPNETCRYDVPLQCTLLLSIISYLVSAFSGDSKNRPRIHKTRWFDSTCLPSPLIPPPCLWYTRDCRSSRNLCRPPFLWVSRMLWIYRKTSLPTRYSAAVWSCPKEFSPCNCTNTHAYVRRFSVIGGDGNTDNRRPYKIDIWSFCRRDIAWGECHHHTQWTKNDDGNLPLIFHNSNKA